MAKARASIHCATPKVLEALATRIETPEDRETWDYSRDERKWEVRRNQILREMRAGKYKFDATRTIGVDSLLAEFSQ